MAKGNSFTLLEMLGVMAVMAILAGVAVPPMLRTLQNVQTVNEDKNLEEIARALTEAIKAEGQIPNPLVDAAANNGPGSKGWVAMAAPYCSLPADSIRYVYPDRPEQTERRFYILTLDTAGGRFLNKPLFPAYSVPPGGWDSGNWPDIKTSFLLIISSSKPDYLLSCPPNDGTPPYIIWINSVGPEAVDWAKSWVKQAINGVYSATNTKIVGLVQNAGSLSWTNQGQFLHVKVIPINNLISEVTFSSAPTGSGPGFEVGPSLSSSLVSFTTPSTTIYVLKGSLVHATDGSVNTQARASSETLTFNYKSSVPSWVISY